MTIDIILALQRYQEFNNKLLYGQKRDFLWLSVRSVNYDFFSQYKQQTHRQLNTQLDYFEHSSQSSLQNIKW